MNSYLLHREGMNIEDGEDVYFTLLVLIYGKTRSTDHNYVETLRNRQQKACWFISMLPVLNFCISGDIQFIFIVTNSCDF